MIRRSLSLLSATAALAVFGGFHLEIASGRALDAPAPNDARLQTATRLADTDVNREAKRDRAEISSTAAEGRTIVFRHPDLQSTTVAVRLWETVSAAKKTPAAKDLKPDTAKRKPAIACEGSVSVLTEVAKQLDVARCVT